MEMQLVMHKSVKISRIFLNIMASMDSSTYCLTPSRSVYRRAAGRAHQRLHLFNHCHSSPCVVQASLVKWLILYQSHLQIITTDFINPTDPLAPSQAPFSSLRNLLPFHSSLCPDKISECHGKRTACLIDRQPMPGIDRKESDIMPSFWDFKIRRWRRETALTSSGNFHFLS